MTVPGRSSSNSPILPYPLRVWRHRELWLQRKMSCLYPVADPFLLLSTNLSIVSFSVDGSGGLYVLAQGEPIQQILPVEKPASAIPPGYGPRES